MTAPSAEAYYLLMDRYGWTVRQIDEMPNLMLALAILR
jgi:hypothetical protein